MDRLTGDSQKYGYGYIVFSHFLDTCHYLQEKLSGEYDVFNIGVRGMSKENVRYLLSKFKERVEELKREESEKRAILIASDRIREGINLQFCNVLFHYDFPFTAAELSQRNGRIDRRGQRKIPYIFNLFLAYGKERFYDSTIMEDFISIKNKQSQEFLYNISKESCEHFRNKIRDRLECKDMLNDLESEKCKIEIASLFISEYRKKMETFYKKIDCFCDANDCSLEYPILRFVVSKTMEQCANFVNEESGVYSLVFKDIKRELYQILIKNPKLARELQFLFVDYESYLRKNGFHYSYEDVMNADSTEILKDEVKFRFRFFNPDKADDVKEQTEIGFLPLTALVALIRRLKNGSRE